MPFQLGPEILEGSGIGKTDISPSYQHRYQLFRRHSMARYEGVPRKARFSGFLTPGTHTFETRHDTGAFDADDNVRVEALHEGDIFLTADRGQNDNRLGTGSEELSSLRVEPFGRRFLAEKQQILRSRLNTLRLQRFSISSWENERR